MSVCPSVVCPCRKCVDTIDVEFVREVLWTRDSEVVITKYVPPPPPPTPLVNTIPMGLIPTNRRPLPALLARVPSTPPLYLDDDDDPSSDFELPEKDMGQAFSLMISESDCGEW